MNFINLKENISKYGRDFWKYIFGQFVSVVGDICGYIAFTWWVLDQTSDTKAIAAIMAPALFFRIFLMPLFGPFGDRFSRKKLLAISEFLRGSISICLAFMILANIYHLPLLIFLFCALSAGTALYYSASGGVVPQLVKKELIEPAIQISQGVMSMGNVMGGVIGGMCVAYLGVEKTYIFDSFSFFLAGLVLLTIKSNTLPKGVKTGAGIKHWFDEVKEGFKLMHKIKILFRWSFLAMVMNFVMAPFGIVLPALIKEAKQMPAWCLGWVEMAGGIGAIIGTMLVGSALKKVKKANLIYGSIFCMGLSCALLPFGNNVYYLMFFMFALTFFSIFCNVPAISQITIATPDKYRSRVFSMMAFMCQGVNPLAIAVVGVAMSKIGISITIMYMGILLSSLALVSPFIPHFLEFFNLSTKDLGSYFEKKYSLDVPIVDNTALIKS